MNSVLVLVNLFIVPIIAVLVHYKIQSIRLKFSIKFLLQYMIFTVYTVLLTKMVIFLVRMLTGKDEIFIDTGYYTILSVLTSVLLPVLFDCLWKIYKNTVCISKKVLMLRENMRWMIIVCVLIILATALTVVPYYANLSEHQISIEVLDEINENSKGNEIKIREIIVDGKSIRPEVILTEGGWFIDEAGLFTWRAWGFPDGIERKAYGTVRASKKIEVHFQTDLWKSIAKVTVDGKTQIVDCFFDSTTQKHWKNCTVDIGEYEKFKPLLLLRNCICIVLLIMLTMRAVVWLNKLNEQNLTAAKVKKGNTVKNTQSSHNKTIDGTDISLSKAVAKGDMLHIKEYFVIPAMTVVLLVHAYITLSDRKIQSVVAENTIEITPAFFYVRLGFLLMMSCLFLILLFSKRLGIKNEDRMYYWLSIGFVLCSLCIRYPIKTWQAEPYWESFSNLLWQTYERGASGSILLDDSGYWTLLPRLIAILALFVFRDIQNAALIAQFFVVALFVFINAKIVKKEFSDYLCTEIRFVIALILGAAPSVGHWDILNLHNIGYCAIVLMLLCCISDLKKLSWPILILDGIIAALGCCSKLQGVVILPIILVILIFGWKRLCNKERVFYSFCILGCLMMIVYVLADIAETIGIGGIQTNIIVLFGASLKHIMQTMLFFIIPYNAGGYWGGGIMNGIVAVALLICIYLCICRFELRRSVICFSLLAYMAGCNLLMALSGRLQFDGFGDFLNATSLFSDRNSFPLIIAALLFILVFLSGRFISSVKKGPLVSFCLLLLLIRFSFIPVGLGTYVNAREQSNWHDYAVCLTKDIYGMPGLNNGWFVLKNAKVYAYTNVEPNKIDAHFFSGVSKHTQIDSDPVNMLSLGDTLSIVSVYAEKTYLLPKEEHIALELRGSDGSILQQVEAIGDRERYAIGFILDEPLDGVTSIAFVNKDTGSEYFVASNIYVVIEAPNRGMSAEPAWGINSLEE